MKFTQVASDAFQKIQLNAGILLSAFDPTSPTVDTTKILGATSGGNTFTVTPTYTDFGEDIDNVPNNTMELKKLDSVDAKLSGSYRTVDTALCKTLIAAADVSGDKITPRSELLTTDFSDIWWVGDYSDVNTDAGSGQSATTAGFIAIRLMNALSTGGFSIKSNDKGKGEISYEYTAHYSLSEIDVVPYEVYIKQGTPSS